MLRGDLGYAAGYGGKPLPFFKNFYAGGPGSVRGYRAVLARPADLNGNAHRRQPQGHRQPPSCCSRCPGAEQDQSLRLACVHRRRPGLRPDRRSELGELRYSAGLALSAGSRPFGPLRFPSPIRSTTEHGDQIQRLQFTFGTGF